MAVTILLGIPIGFAIGISTMLFLFIEGTIPITIMVQKLVAGVESFPLIALPLFILSGGIMLYGSTPKIMNFTRLILRKKRWGTGSATSLACAGFGAISGSTVATTSAIGSITGPEMTKMGYPKGFSAPLIAASGTIGGIIPPATGFIIYAQVANVSIADMFIAGILPGLMLTWMFTKLNKHMVIKNDWCQSNNDEEYYAELSSKEKRKIILDAFLPFLTPVFILGGVISGVVTATEASAVACVYALILSIFVYKKLNFKNFLKVFKDSAVMSAIILFIIAQAAAFAWVLTTNNIHIYLRDLILGISDNVIIIYGLIILILLILGTFMEALSIILLTTPVLLPIVTSVGVDPIAYGVTASISLAIGTVTPPLAVSLFTACKILKIKMEDTFPYSFYVLFVMVIAAVITAVFPQISLFLPNLLS